MSKRNGDELKYGRPRSEETKKKMSNSAKGNTHGFQKGQSAYNKGLKHSLETRIKMRKNHKGTLGFHHSEETKKKISEKTKERMKSPIIRQKIRDALLGRIMPLNQREKISKNLKGRHIQEVNFKNILSEIPELEKQGFRCIPIGKVIPDIIAIKNNKVYAIEVERSNSPRYSKYDNKDHTKYYDDIIWILRKNK